MLLSLADSGDCSRIQSRHGSQRGGAWPRTHARAVERTPPPYPALSTCDIMISSPFCLSQRSLHGPSRRGQEDQEARVQRIQ